MAKEKEINQSDYPVIGEDRKVKITVPKIPNEKDQPDLVVSVNGKNYIIQRGIEVSVPKNVAEIIRCSLKNEAKAEEYYYSVAR